MKKKEKRIKFYTEKSEQKTSLKSEINDKYLHKVEIQNLNDSNKKESQLIQIINKFEKENDSTENIYYIPICRNNGCEGHLKIKIDEENFCINGKCQNNKEHIFNNIYFETFERFYIKKYYKRRSLTP